MKTRKAKKFRGGSVPIQDMNPVRKALLDLLAPFAPANILLIEDLITTQVKDDLLKQGHSVYLTLVGSIKVRKSAYPNEKWNVRRNLTGLPLFETIVSACMNFQNGKNGLIATTSCPRSTELLLMLKSCRHIDHATRIIALADKSQEIFREPSPTRVLSRVNWIITAPTGTVLNGNSNLRRELEPSQPEFFDSFLQLT